MAEDVENKDIVQHPWVQGTTFHEDIVKIAENDKVLEELTEFA